jgi:hypothetical protein
MKLIFQTVLALLLAVPAIATPDPAILKKVIESQPSCQSFIRYDESNAYFGFGAYLTNFDGPRRVVPGDVKVVPLDGSPAFRLNTPDSPVDIITDVSQAYILTYTDLELWDLTTKNKIESFPTTLTKRTLQYKEHAAAMVRFGDKLFIAHGRLGVSVFDIKTQKLTNEIPLLQDQAPYESMATGIAIQGDKAYVLMDSFTLSPADQKQAFRGFVAIDLASELVVDKMDGIEPGASSLASFGSKLVINHYGQPLSMYDSQIFKNWPTPQVNLWKLPVKGSPVGTAVIDANYYYTCFAKAPEKQPGGFYPMVPMAFDRRVLQIDDSSYNNSFIPLSNVSFNNGRLLAVANWKQGPSVGGESILRLNFVDAKTQMAIDPQAKVEASVFMPAMGHGSAPVSVLRVIDTEGQLETGTYQISNVYFMMAGQWQVVIKLSYDNGQVEQKTLNVTL